MSRGGTPMDVEAVMRLHPRDLATMIDIWEEVDAAARR